MVLRLLLPALLVTGLSTAAAADDTDRITRPEWMVKPDAKALASVFPAAALKARKAGKATIACDVTAEGFLQTCKVASESPEGLGFGAAALQLAAHFRMKPAMRDGKPVAGGTITIPIIWQGVPDTLSIGGAVLLDPPWTQVPTWAEVQAVWPKGAPAGTAGQVTLRCNLNMEGQLRGCETLSEIPVGQGFAKAAKNLTPSFRVSVNPNDPKVKKYTVDVPFRFRDPAAPDTRSLSMAHWISTLTAEGMASVFPESATQAGVKTGSSAVRCVLTTTGAMTDCKALRESPANLGFGAAAVKAASLMRMNPWTKEGDPVDGLPITVPISFAWDDSLPPEPSPPTAKPH